MPLEASIIPADHPNFPPILHGETLWAIGDPGILSHHLLALFCSVKCPGEAIVRTYDLARALRDAGIPIIGGFHSPMEQECLDFLLRGKQPVVIFPARGIQGMRIPATWQEPLREGRLLIMSPFPANYRRPTAMLAERRNRLIGSLAGAAFVAFAEAGGKTSRLCAELLAQGKAVYTHELDSTRALITLGAHPASEAELVRRIAATLSLSERG